MNGPHSRGLLVNYAAVISSWHMYTKKEAHVCFYDQSSARKEDILGLHVTGMPFNSKYVLF